MNIINIMNIIINNSINIANNANVGFYCTVKATS